MTSSRSSRITVRLRQNTQIFRSRLLMTFCPVEAITSRAISPQVGVLKLTFTDSACLLAQV